MEHSAEALARYLGADYEAYQRPSGIWGVRAKPLSVTPDYGTTKAEPLVLQMFADTLRVIPPLKPGQVVPY